jgi:hypothetical protein
MTRPAIAPNRKIIARNRRVGGTPVLNGLAQRLGGATSDHLPQFIRVALRRDNGSTTAPLRVATWNLMDRCYDDSLHGPDTANNPLKMAEDQGVARGQPTPQRDARKAEQVEEILGMLDQNDVILLQEVSDLWGDFQDKTSRLRQEMRRLGFSHIRKSSRDQQALIMLYRTARLQEVQGGGRGIFSSLTQPGTTGVNKCRGYAADFTDSSSGQVVTIANLHLRYDLDYTADIAAFQAARIAEGKMCIMGGDTNHAQGIDCVGLIGDVDLATNVTYVKGLGDGAPVVLTDEDARRSGVKKHYDGFFVSPTADTVAVVTETAQSQFFAVKADGNFAVMERGDEKTYESLRGQAWSAAAAAPVLPAAVPPTPIAAARVTSGAMPVGGTTRLAPTGAVPPAVVPTTVPLTAEPRVSTAAQTATPSAAAAPSTTVAAGSASASSLVASSSAALIEDSELVDIKNFVDSNAPPSSSAVTLQNFIAMVDSQRAVVVPKVPYRGIGVQAHVCTYGAESKTGLKIFEVFSPENGRFTNEAGAKTTPKKNEIIVSIKVGSRAVILLDDIFRGNSQDAALKNLASLFHSNDIVTFETSSGKKYSCDNRINKTAIFAPKVMTDSKINWKSLSQLLAEPDSKKTVSDFLAQSVAPVPSRSGGRGG